MKLIFFPLLVISNLLYAVNTNISGVVNSYAPITAITSNTITIGSVSPAHTFVCGDRVMIIQMKGADIDSTNTVNFGNILNINNAGNYEMANVSSVSGSTIIFSRNLTKSYTVAGLIQAIYVPHYEDATVTAKLTAQAWNGTTGGVLAIEIDGTLTLNANIDASQLGFRGGNYHPITQVTPNKVVCGSFFGSSVYNGNVGSEYRYNNAEKRYAVEKGESITSHYTYLWGRGKLASAGGGGGIESGGGGGGANAGSGGNAGGGNPTSTSFACVMPAVNGLGGAGLNSYYSNEKVFLGGGSGAGNNGNDSTAAIYYFAATVEVIAAPGRKGGGIIYIKANTLNGNNKIITADGEAGYTAITLGNFGGGGGGAGGTVIMNVNQYISNVTINANGGVGSTVRVDASASSTRRRGAGGGGGGGSILFYNASLPSGVLAFDTAGNGGLSYDKSLILRSTHYGEKGGIGSISFNYTEIGADNNSKNLVSSTTSTSEVVYSNRRIDFTENGILASINSNGNNLGNTSVTTTLGSNGPFTSTGCSVDEFYLPRVYSIVPINQPSSDCDVSLYLTGAELNDFITFTNAQSSTYKNCWGAVDSINDLMVTVVHTSGSAEALVPNISYISCSDIYKLDVKVGQFSTFYIHSNKGLFTGNILPIEWLGFEANFITKDKIELKWATGVEINNDGFYVERSFDGVNFETLTWVNGQGNYNGKTDYRYIDNIDVYEKNENVYYRLKQVDYNGEQEYSKIVVLKLELYNFIGEIFPNPANTVAFLEVINNSEKQVNLSIYNTIGKLVQTNSFQTTFGKTEINIELDNLPSGIYSCIVEINGEKSVRRLIKK